MCVRAPKKKKHGPSCFGMKTGFILRLPAFWLLSLLPSAGPWVHSLDRSLFSFRYIGFWHFASSLYFSGSVFMRQLGCAWLPAALSIAVI